MLRRIDPFNAAVLVGPLLDGLDLDLIRVRQTQRQLVAVDLQLHGISLGRKLHHGDLRPGDHAHVQEMLPQGSFPANLRYHGTFPDFQILQCHPSHLFLSYYFSIKWLIPFYPALFCAGRQWRREMYGLRFFAAMPRTA